MPSPTTHDVHSKAYSIALTMMTRWAQSLVPTDTPSQWVPALAEVALYWCYSSSKQVQKVMTRSLLSMDSEDLLQLLAQIGHQFGPEAMFAAHKLSHVLSTGYYADTMISSMNHMLVEIEYKPLKKPTLSLKQQVFGSAVIDRILGIRSQQKPFTWETSTHGNGPLALPLIATGLTQLERVCFSSLMLDALAKLHVKRLQEQQGFAPEYMFINHRFEIIAPESRATQLTLLHSPELHLSTIHHMTADVWALARLLFPVLTGKSMTTPIKDMASLVPPEVRAPLKRSLEIQPDERFYSGRELRVVLNMPLKLWIERLQYEKTLREEQESDSLPYEELTALRDYELEKKVKQRRVDEVDLRKKIAKRQRIKQQLWLILIGIICTAAYMFYQQKQNEHQEKIQKIIDQKVQRARTLYEQDQAYQVSVPQSLKKLNFQWRFIDAYIPDEAFKEVRKAVPAFLISESEITEAQYQSCVQANKCPARTHHKDCQLDPNADDHLPVTCITFEQARSFARFVGGDIPSTEQWIWTAFEHRRIYPWGNAPTPDKYHANIRHQTGGHAPEIATVCAHRFGDSPQAICDLVGNVHEWVIMDEFINQDQKNMVIAGLIGGGWFSKPKALQLYKATQSDLNTVGYDVGFRVVKQIHSPTPTHPATATE